VHWVCYYATTLDIEVDPQRRRSVKCASVSRWAYRKRRRKVWAFGCSLHVATAPKTVVSHGQVEDQAPAARRILEVAAELHVAAPLACACRHAVIGTRDLVVRTIVFWKNVWNIEKEVEQGSSEALCVGCYASHITVV
jgi:hypothetical protein